MLSGPCCRITRGSGTLDKRSDSICSRNRGRRRNRWASRRRRYSGLDGDDTGHYADDNDADDNANHDDSGRPWHDPRNG